MTAEEQDGPTGEPARPFQKGYKPTPEQLQKMKDGREAAAERRRNEPVAELTVAGGKTRPKQAPSKGGAITALDKEVIRRAFEAVNLAVDLTGNGQGADPNYRLTAEEIAALTDALADVAAQTPQIRTMLVSGRKISVWGNLLIVSFFVVGQRIALYESKRKSSATGGPAAGSTAPGPARPLSGDDGLRQNDTGAEAPFIH